jgi:asparagine synthase (glutamine-hydrolysing)
MCGVVGYCGGGVNPAEAGILLRHMTDAVAHRGPDDSAIHVGEGAGLGHVRLAIVGLADGKQPMASADGRIHISFNGEIFNYVELREAMMARGRRFATSSDTEVLLQLYEEMGPDCVSVLNGDFAFAIWDERKRRMLLARDRMGVRPLFYTFVGTTIYFASEIKALLRVPGVVAEADPIALDQIFTLWAPLPPRTAFKQISELPPAHIMLVERGNATLRPYWKLDYPDLQAPRDARSKSAIAEELHDLLADATRIRLRADVPVGAYLSGGLDSSIVSALAAGLIADRLRTFSVTFDSAEHDESAHQAEMVRALGTRHSSVLCRSQDIAAVFAQILKHTERPILRTAPAPLYQLARLVRDEGFKVVLTGEGADEVFAGYDIFKEASVRRFCARQPQSRMRPLLFRKLYPYLPGLQKQSPDYLAAFFAAGSDDVDDPLFSHRPRFRSTAATKLFFSADLRATLGSYDATAELRETLPADFCRWHPLHQAQFLEATVLLPGYILSSQGDRMAMAHGVEGRFPFLDHRLVEFAARIPPGMKLNGLMEKHILKQAAKDLLPSSILERTKQPYRAPDSQSFTGSGRIEHFAALLAPDAIGQTGLFDPVRVAKLVEKGRHTALSGYRDNSAFVGILSTQLWHQQFAAEPRRRQPKAA